MTKEEIKARLLAEINDEYDKAEGSFFSDAVTPVAIELENAYANQGAILSEAFIETASGEYLSRRCAELGITRKPATKATGQVEITGAVGASITQGSLVASDLATYAITESKTIGASGKETVLVECLQFGTIGNVPVGAIRFFPITLEGLSAVTNLANFTNGFDAESDESLRQRYYDKVNAPSTSGNAGHYKQWAKSVTGVGDARVIPLWTGAGTVKVVICNANKRAAGTGLIATTQEYIEAERPIGATVTVESATEKAISVTATITLGGGRTLGQVSADFEAALVDYFKAIAFVSNYVSYARIGSILYDIPGVTDYTTLRVNSGTANVALADVELPVVGTVVLS